MENDRGGSKEKDVVVDIESGKNHEVNGRDRNNRNRDSDKDRDRDRSKRGKRTLEKISSGVLNYDGEGSVTKPHAVPVPVPIPVEASVQLLVDKNGEEEQAALIKKERRKGGKVKKAAKPPRPPNGPNLSAADLRLIKEITEIAMKKRERMERIKALKKMQAARASSSTSNTIKSHGSSIVALSITFLFFIVLIVQGFITNNNSSLSPTAAPQPAPQIIPLEFYKSDGVVSEWNDDESSSSTTTSREKQLGPDLGQDH